MRCVKCSITIEEQIEVKSFDQKVVLKHVMCEKCFDKIIDDLYSDDDEQIKESD